MIPAANSSFCGKLCVWSSWTGLGGRDVERSESVGDGNDFSKTEGAVITFPAAVNLKRRFPSLLKLFWVLIWSGKRRRRGSGVEPQSSSAVNQSDFHRSSRADAALVYKLAATSCFSGSPAGAPPPSPAFTESKRKTLGNFQ